MVFAYSFAGVGGIKKTGELPERREGRGAKNDWPFEKRCGEEGGRWLEGKREEKGKMRR